MKDETRKMNYPGDICSPPPEYWETGDARQGGIIGNISEKGLWIRSLVDMYVGEELRIKVFFPLGYKFDDFAVSAKIVGKDPCCDEGWQTYEYELEFTRISEEARLKLRNLLKIRQLRPW